MRNIGTFSNRGIDGLNTYAPVSRAGLLPGEGRSNLLLMDTREAVIAEIRTAPESVVEEVLDFVRFLKNKTASATPQPQARIIPDFDARKRELFGDRVLPDSLEILDELRADRL